MSHLKYEVVEHDGGWAYRVGGAYSETFRTHDDALSAAKDASERQHLAGETQGISYQNAEGKWQEEVARGDDRPETEIVDRP